VDTATDIDYNGTAIRSYASTSLVCLRIDDIVTLVGPGALELDFAFLVELTDV